MSTRTLTRNAIASAGQVALSAAAMFVLYRILLDHLTVDEIGLWALIVGSVAVARLSEFGLGTGVVRFVAHDLGAGQSARAAGTIGLGAAGVAMLISAAAVAAYFIARPLVVHAVPDELVGEAIGLLPLALVALVIGSVANAFSSAIDGLQRMEIRAAIQLSGNLLQLALVFLLTPKYGLISLGWVQVLQSATILIANMVACLVLLGEPVGHYLRWDPGRFRELLKFGGSIQLAAIGQMLFEPAVKVLLTAFSGLALTGYFEMANRLTQQFRTILVSAYNALVPHVASRLGSGSTQAAVIQSYNVSTAFLLAIAFPYFAIVGATLPSFIYFWTGEVSPTFLTAALLMWVAWSINTLAGPAYFISLASGDLRWIVGSQVSIGVLNLLLGTALGFAFGGVGALSGSAIALAAGSLTLPVAFIVKHRISMGALFRLSSLPGFLLWMLAGIGIVSSTSRFNLASQFVGLFGVGILACGVLFFNPELRRHAHTLIEAYRR